MQTFLLADTFTLNDNAGHKNKSDATHTFRTNHLNDYTYLTSCKYEHIQCQCPL